MKKILFILLLPCLLFAQEFGQNGIRDADGNIVIDDGSYYYVGSTKFWEWAYGLPNAVEAGIDNSGDTDVSANVQSFIRTNKTVFFPAGTYYLGTQVYCEDDSDYVIIGVPGATWFKRGNTLNYPTIKGATYNSLVAFINCNRVIIEGIGFDFDQKKNSGANGSGNGLRFQSIGAGEVCEDITVKNCTFRYGIGHHYDLWGKYVFNFKAESNYFYSFNPDTASYNAGHEGVEVHGRLVQVLNNEFRGIEGNCVYIYSAGNDFLVSGNKAFDFRYSFIKVIGQSGDIGSGIVSENICKNEDLASSSFITVSNEYGNNAGNIIVSDNVCDSIRYGLEVAYNSNNILVERNVISHVTSNDANGGAIQIRWASVAYGCPAYISLKNNILADINCQGILLGYRSQTVGDRIRHVRVEGNKLKNIRRNGLYADSLSVCWIEKNDFINVGTIGGSDSTTNSGIYALLADSLRIIDNWIDDENGNMLYGICISDTSGHSGWDIIERNTIQGEQTAKILVR